MKKNYFCKYPHKFYIKDRTTKNHWVEHSLTNPMYDDELFNRRVKISKLKTCLNDYGAIYASGITELQP